jgi:hypothetical protein
MTTATTGHTLTINPDAMTLTISGPTETMDSIPDIELRTAALQLGLAVDFERGPLNETSYALRQIETLADLFD